MTACDQDVVLYFYGELDADARARIDGHLRTCSACRQRLEDLHTIREALAAAPAVNAPPAGDWSGFMRRLDRSTEGLRPSGSPARSLARRFAAIAALLAVVAMGVFMAARARSQRPPDVVASGPVSTPAPMAADPGAAGANAEAKESKALREVSAEHLERSKLVVIGLATRDPQQTRAADWQYERQLAGSLLAETRLYRLTAQERGVSDVARVMRDLETVLLEASMTDGRDRNSLGRVQRLIERRGLVSRMQVVKTSAGL